MKIPTEVPSSLRELAAVLSQPKPMRRGSVSERTMKCGKAGCPCQEDPKARHGPYYSLTRPTAGKTHSRYLSPEQAQLHGSKSSKGINFGNRWSSIERLANNGPMPNWNGPQQLPERPKKGAPNRPSEGNHPGNRNTHREPVDRGLGFRSGRNGGAAPVFALGSARVGTTAQHGHQRSCGTATALPLRRLRPVSWPSRKDLRKRTGAFAPAARLLSL